MKEETYRRVTCGLTVSVAKTLANLNPTMTFVYLSGAGTDSTERGRRMWARVKGRTENALLQMRFKAVFLFRPAYIQLLHGIRTKTRWYGAAYRIGTCEQEYLFRARVANAGKSFQSYLRFGAMAS